MIHKGGFTRGGCESIKNLNKIEGRKYQSSQVLIARETNE